MNQNKYLLKLMHYYHIENFYYYLKYSITASMFGLILSKEVPFHADEICNLRKDFSDRLDPPVSPEIAMTHWGFGVWFDFCED